MSRDTIKVAARFRPLNKREKKRGKNELGCDVEEGLPGGDQLRVSFGGKRQEFSFDFLFRDAVAQEDVYARAAQESVVNLFNGYNGTIFAYGQTGSGKTHSMYGPQNVGEQCGIVPRAVLHIFDHMFQAQGSMVEEFSVRCAFCELYNESVNDLLDAGKRNLNIRESPAKGIYIADLTWEYAGSEEDIFDFLELGQRNRKTASTDMNETSSRSHSIFMLELTQKRMDGTTRVARLNLVDLAGSESVKKTNATGQTFDEAKKINLSLSALGNCIKALTAKGGTGRGHIPYRDSKLTRILQESLGGNSKTTLLVCLSPHHDNFEETLSTLRFAQRAKQIVTRARVNERQSPEMMQQTIQALRKDLRVAQAAYERLTAWLAREHPEVEVPANLLDLAAAAAAGGRAKARKAANGVGGGGGGSSSGRKPRRDSQASVSSVDTAGGDTYDDETDGDEDGLEAKSSTEKLLELKNLRAALEDRVGALEAQVADATAQAALQANQLKEAQAHLADARDARTLAENTAKSKAKRLRSQLKSKDAAATQHQEHAARLRQAVSMLRLDAVGLAARNAALQLQMVQMQDALVVAACFGGADDGGAGGGGGGAMAGEEQQRVLARVLAQVAGGAAGPGAGGGGACDSSATAEAGSDDGSTGAASNPGGGEQAAGSSAAAQEAAAKLAFLEEENAKLRQRLEDSEAGAGAAAAQAAGEAQEQLAEMDAQADQLKGDVARLEREVETLSKRNAFLEEANARSTRGLRAGRAVVAVSKRRQAQMKQLQKQKKGAGLYTAMRGMLRKTGSPLLSKHKEMSPAMADVVLDAVEQQRGGGGGGRARLLSSPGTDSGMDTGDEEGAAC